MDDFSVIDEINLPTVTIDLVYSELLYSIFPAGLSDLFNHILLNEFRLDVCREVSLLLRVYFIAHACFRIRYIKLNKLMICSEVLSFIRRFVGTINVTAKE